MLSFTAEFLSFAPGETTQTVLAVDMNNDGVLDLVTGNIGSNTIGVRLNDGQGGFGNAEDYPAGTTPHSIAVGDFDDDGNLDLVAASGFYGPYSYGIRNQVRVLFGDGDGGFEPPQNIAIGERDIPASVAVGDFDQDGLMDIAIASTYDMHYPSGFVDGYAQVSIVWSREGRTFDGPHLVWDDLDTGWSGNVVNRAIVTDFDTDGNQDIVVGFGGGNAVQVLLNDGHGQFVNVSGATWSMVQSSGMAVGDLNGDGVPDLVGADYQSVRVRLGNNQGGFVPPPGGQSYSAGSGITSIAVGDFDQDGRLDVAVGDSWNGSVNILRGRGDGTLAPPESFPAGAQITKIAAADFNGDGWLDIAAANSTTNGVTVLQNNKIWPSTPPPVPPAQLYVSDASVREGKRGYTYLEFTVGLLSPATGPVTVDYATQNGSATAGSDYLATSGRLSFAKGETTKTVRVTIVGDSIVEPNESFQLVLSNVTGNAVIADAVGIGEILNDDVLRGPKKKPGRWL